ncbi:hypothetical protein U1Q18_029996 [Sarracenia purpurea var. burkii]
MLQLGAGLLGFWASGFGLWFFLVIGNLGIVYTAVWLLGILECCSFWLSCAGIWVAGLLAFAHVLDGLMAFWHAMVDGFGSCYGPSCRCNGLMSC